MLPNSLLKMNTLQHLLKIKYLTIIGTAVHLHSHADGSLVGTVGMKPDLGSEDHWVQVLLDCNVGVCVSLQNLTVLYAPVSDPLVQSWSPVLQHVVLGELCPLTIAEPAHGLRGGDGVDTGQVDLDPLGTILANHVPRTPGSTILIKSNSKHGKMLTYKCCVCKKFSQINSKICGD